MAKKRLTVAVAYRGIPHARGWATGDNLVRAFTKLGHKVYPYGNYYETDERLNKEPLPEELDLLVYCECNDFDPQYEDLRDQKARARVYWDFDVDNGREDVTVALIKRIGFDMVCYANKLYGDRFKKLVPRILFLPYAFDETHFFPQKIKSKIDVALVGTPYKQRLEYAKKLKKLGADLEFVYGKYREDFAKAINGLKIHLNLNVFGPGGNGLLVMRVWETIGCGTFLLNQRKDFIEDFFEDGKHLVLFDSPEECAEKIKYYLSHSAEREKIAKAGYEYGLKNHTYVARAQSIIDNVNDLLENQSPRKGPRHLAHRIKHKARATITGQLRGAR